MSLGLLSRRCQAVYHEGARYVCRAPTVATAHALFAEYGRDAAILAHNHRKHGTFDLTTAVRLAVLRNDSAVRVLQTCVDSDRPSEEWPLELLARRVIGLTDAEGFLEQIDLDRLADLSPDADGLGIEDIDEDMSVAAIVDLGRTFGCSPADVMEWPYDSLPTIMRGTEALAEARRRGESGRDPFLELARKAALQHTRAREKAN